MTATAYRTFEPVGVMKVNIALFPLVGRAAPAEEDECG
jgi:hypothetical protein